MQNNCYIHDDGIILLISLVTKPKLWVKTGLVLICIFLLAPLIILLTVNEESLSFGRSFGVIIFLVLYALFPLRFTLWNLFGKEHIIINRQTLSYKHDYGLTITKLKTIEMKCTRVGFKVAHNNESGELGHLVILNYNNDTNMPENKYTSINHLHKSDFLEISRRLNRMYENITINSNDLISFSCN